MGQRPRSVLIIAGPADRPDGCAAAAERYAERLGLDVTWRNVDGAPALLAGLAAAGAHDAVVLDSGRLAASTDVAEAVATTTVAVVHVDTAVVDHLDVVPRACDHVIQGRHRRSFHGALDLLYANWADPPTTVPYGDGSQQVGDLRLPTDPSAAPVVALFHGGYWLDPYERDLMGPLAVALTRAGWATWNIEYRRCGPTGGGWPTTLQDACAAVDALSDLAQRFPIDPRRVVLLGHSAGAQLALYAAGRGRAPSDAPGTTPSIQPSGVISLAGVLDLQVAAIQGLGGGATEGFLGVPADHPDHRARARLASPIERVPVGVPQLVVHGPDDRLVPVEQSRSYVEAARRAGDNVEQAEVGAAHLELLAPWGPAWPMLTGWLATRT